MIYYLYARTNYNRVILLKASSTIYTSSVWAYMFLCDGTGGIELNIYSFLSPVSATPLVWKVHYQTYNAILPFYRKKHFQSLFRVWAAVVGCCCGLVVWAAVVGNFFPSRPSYLNVQLLCSTWKTWYYLETFKQWKQGRHNNAFLFVFIYNSYFHNK